ncbi:MAG TPA: LpqB family beta-propeller domain-containing protein, partial [Vicinamibacteria bacterium]|nr:LpqB family beta-propeller domain-containing protein [Vicinamibacteria bacterium]
MPVYRFDDITVDTAAFRVARGPQPIPLEPKAFDLLVLLLERPGQLVTKQEILDGVWRQTAVSDNALTRIVAHLRKALGDDARDARYIETIPTRGYRWRAPLERSEAAAAAAPTASSPTRAPRSFARRVPAAWLTAILAVLAVMATLSGVSFARRRAMETRAGSGFGSLWPSQVTVSPSLDAFPALAPDGRALAFASDRTGGFELVVKSLAAGAREVPLTSDGQQNVEPAWSPDGEYVAYHSMKGGGLWMVPARGGVPRRVTDFGSAPAWSPDGRRIAFQSDPLADIAPTASEANVPSTIWTVAADGSDPRRLTVPTNPVGGHGCPAWSPDGRRIVFTTYSAAPSRLWSVPASGGTATLLAESHVPIHDPVFAPDGRSLYYASGGPFVVRVPLAPGTGLPTGEPEALATPGLPSARHLSISGDGRRIAMAVLTLRSNLWMIPVTADGAGSGEPRALTDDTSR